MLVDEDAVAIWVDHHKARRTSRRLIRFILKLYARLFKLALKFPDIDKIVNRFALIISSGIKGQDIFLKHALKKTNGFAAIAQD